MSNTVYQKNGSKDRHHKQVMFDLRIEMTTKLARLRTEQTQLVAKLEKGFDNDTFRALSIVNHKIEVTTVRHKGGWLSGSFPEITTSSITRI